MGRTWPAMKEPEEARAAGVWWGREGRGKTDPSLEARGQVAQSFERCGVCRGVTNSFWFAGDGQVLAMKVLCLGNPSGLSKLEWA